jgi:uncharacterized protein (TIRG00374 family)
MSRRVHLISWLIGVAALAVLVWYFRPADFLSSVRRVGVAGVTSWLAITLVARFLYAEVPTQLLRALGYRLARMQVYAIAWLRTFSNQVVPMTGIAVYLQQIREKSGASWQDLAASSSQQVFIGIAALGAVGLIAVGTNTRVTAEATLPLLFVFASLCAAASAAALGVSGVISKLPRFLTKRIAAAADSFGKLSSNRKLIAALVCVHGSGILLRGARLWLLFEVLGVVLEWHEALLIVALAEATVLIAITPGGLGIREAIIVGGASLLDIPTDVAVAVSLIDRLFVVALTGVMAAPSAMVLFRRPAQGHGRE